MSLEDIKARLPDFAKDVRLNISQIANDEAMKPETKWGLLLTAAIATRNAALAKAVQAEASAKVGAAVIVAAKACASIMAMNTVYYRFTHLASEKVYGTMPAKLRMTIMANPGAPKDDFELWSLAVAAIVGCGMCIDSHEKVLREHGVPAETIHTAIRYASIMASAAVALEASEL